MTTFQQLPENIIRNTRGHFVIGRRRCGKSMMCLDLIKQFNDISSKFLVRLEPFDNYDRELARYGVQIITHSPELFIRQLMLKQRRKIHSGIDSRALIVLDECVSFYLKHDNVLYDFIQNYCLYNITLIAIQQDMMPFQLLDSFDTFYIFHNPTYIEKMYKYFNKSLNITYDKFKTMHDEITQDYQVMVLSTTKTSVIQ